MSNLWSQPETILSSKTLKCFCAYDIKTLIDMKQSEVKNDYLDIKNVIAEFKTVKKAWDWQHPYHRKPNQ